MAFLGFWEEVAAELGLTFPDLYLIVIFLLGFIFLAKDIKIGLIFYLLGFGAGFVFFVSAGLPTNKILIASFLALLAMALSLFSSHQKRGGVY